jgi:hypothetical protein
LATETECAGALGEQLQRVEAQDTVHGNGTAFDTIDQRRHARYQRSRWAESR